MKKIADYIQNLNATQITDAEKYLTSNKVKSIKFMKDELDPNEFEAFICERNLVFTPGIEVDENFNVLDIHCQCESDAGICIHEAALLLAAQQMINSNCSDYHMASKIQTAKTLSGVLFPN